MNTKNEIYIEEWRIPYSVFENSDLIKLDIMLDEFDLGNYEELKPDFIGKLTQLVSLNLTGVRISNTIFQNEICNLKNLEQLTLMYADIQVIPHEIENLLNLKSITLRGNRIKDLPESIINLQNLSSINLGYNKINSLPKNYSKLSNLKNIDLMGNPIIKKNQDLFDEFGKLSFEKYFKI